MFKRLRTFILILGIVLVVPASSMVFAYPSGTYGSGTYNSCQYGTTCSITLSSNGSISLNVTPASGGKCTIQSDTASVLTDDTNGYTLTLADNGTNTSLVNGSHTIAVGSGTIGSPAALTPNGWGYRIDGFGSFGSGPTNAQSNVSPSGALFAAIQASNATPDTIATTSVAADPAAITTVWYGVCANTSVTSGTYSTLVTYTALAN